MDELIKNQIQGSCRRDNYLDFLKGFLIIMVVWWHTTTMLWTGIYNSNNFPIKSFTATFGMPLFMFISGYLLSTKTLYIDIKNKVLRVLIPTLFWELFLTIATQKFSFGGLALWYLYSYFVCSVIVILTIHLVHNTKVRGIILTIICIACFFLPIDTWYVSWMLPCFCVGYLFKFIGKNIVFNNKYSKICIIATAVILSIGWKWDYTVYESGSTLYKNLDDSLIYFYREILAIINSIAVVQILFYLYSHLGKKIKQIIEYCGKYSMDIYVIHCILINKAITKILIHFNCTGFDLDIPHGVINYLISPIVAICIVLACLLFSNITSKSSILRIVMWGRKK